MHHAAHYQTVYYALYKYPCDMHTNCCVYDLINEENNKMYESRVRFAISFLA